MDGFRGVVEQKLDVIHKTQQQAGEFIAQVGRIFLDEHGAGHRLDDVFQSLLRFSPALVETKRRDGMSRRIADRTDTVRRGWTGKKQRRGRH